MTDRIGIYDHRRKVGNAADVWKHLLLLTVVDHMSLEKDFGSRPFRYYESHCGRGVYLLPPKGEWGSGVGRAFPPPRPLRLHPYFRLLGPRPSPGGLYFGSWFLVAVLLQQRGLDFRLTLCDSSPEVARHMSSMGISEATGGKVRFRNADGFSLPPEPGGWDLALIDPPYNPDHEADRRRSMALVQDLVRRGTSSLLWYPVLEGMKPDPNPPCGIVLELFWPRARDRPTPHMRGCGILVSGRISRFLLESLSSLRSLADRLKADLQVRGREPQKKEEQ